MIQEKFVELDNKIDNLIEHIPGVQQMLAIKGVWRDTVAGFFAEVGNLQDYNHPRQIIKLAGLSLKRTPLASISKATKPRAMTLWGSMTDIHLLERLDEGI